jgi:hypothetical protein
MALCSNCHKRRAKRRCPALGGHLCPLCCGMLRQKTLHCPPACPQLARHHPYQERKIIKKRSVLAGPDVREDERLNWLVLNLEAALLSIAEARPEFTDRDAVLALEYAWEKIEKERTSVLVVEGPGAPKNEAGESILEVADRTRFEGRIILAQSVQTYTKDEKMGCLEVVIQAIKRSASPDFEGRPYLTDLSRRFSRSQESAPGKRIISPR